MKYLQDLAVCGSLNKNASFLSEVIELESSRHEMILRNCEPAKTGIVPLKMS